MVVEKENDRSTRPPFAWSDAPIGKISSQRKSSTALAHCGAADTYGKAVKAVDLRDDQNRVIASG
jgi:hypothetical protein